MCCQLQEQSVWEWMEGGKQGGELLFWGHSRGKVPCNTAGPKAQQPIFTELCPAPRNQTSSSLCPDFTKTRRLPALTLPRGELVQNEVPRIYAPTRNQIVSRSDFLWFCPVLPISKFIPSSKPDAQLLQSCCSPAGRGCHWPWAAVSRDKDWTYLPGTDTSVELFLALTPVSMRKCNISDVCPLWSPVIRHSHVIRGGLGLWVQVGGWWDVICLISLGNEVKQPCPPLLYCTIELRMVNAHYEYN